MFSKKKNNPEAQKLNTELEKSLQDEIVKILGKISNPITGKAVIDSPEPVKASRAADGRIELTIPMPADRPAQLSVEAQIRTAWAASPLKKDGLKIVFPPASKTPPKPAAPAQGANRMSGVKTIIAVSSGKGGVGKSTVAMHLASALAHAGKKTGILDADIYGPSIGKMAGIQGKADMKMKGDKIIPIDFNGIKLMSFGFFIDPGQAVVWRGPMLGKALEQFLFDIDWGDLDYLVIDMPPGTGDAHLSLAQLAAVDGAVIVTTPQEVAVLDAERAVSMYDQVNIPILGVIENMTEFVCPHCDSATEIFSRGGGSKLAERTSSALLGSVPLTLPLMKAAEAGVPLTSPQARKESDNPSVKRVIDAFDGIANTLLQVVGSEK